MSQNTRIVTVLCNLYHLRQCVDQHKAASAEVRAYTSQAMCAFKAPPRNPVRG